MFTKEWDYPLFFPTNKLYHKNYKNNTYFLKKLRIFYKKYIFYQFCFKHIIILLNNFMIEQIKNNNDNIENIKVQESEIIVNKNEQF